jgi:hypothetical protein
MSNRAHEFWEERKYRYPFCATSSTKVRPERVPGKHLSVVFSTRIRTWGFATQAERDAFVAAHPSAEVRECT